jgi:multidrug efflux pump subunit AcrA (membrane-fusion protein)
VTSPGAAALPLSAPRVAAPQRTDPTRRTIDFYYRVQNAGGTLRPGQAVAVQIPVTESVERLVVPFSALLWDGHGNTWIYVRDGENAFRRRRVEAGRRLGDDIVVERGATEGAEIVVVGAQVLYGEEFKSTAPVDDD